MKQSWRGAWMPLLLWATGCGPGLPPESLVEKLRVLAIAPTPPEVSPGAALSWRALVATPDEVGVPLVYTFVMCTPGPSGCVEQQEALEDAGGDPELAAQLYQQRAVRFGLMTPQAGYAVAIGANMVTARTALDGAPNPEEGTNTQVTLVVCTADACASSSTDPGGDLASTLDSLPPEASALAVKRARLSTSQQPNHNPQVLRVDAGEGALTGGGTPVGDEGTVTLVPGEALDLNLVMDQGSAEPYVYVTDDGVSEERTERLFVDWYATAGSFEYDTTTPYVEEGTGLVKSAGLYYPPLEEDAPEGVTLYAVVWDRRGGMAWWTATGTFEP